jgi:hypothetical protein
MIEELFKLAAGPALTVVAGAITCIFVLEASAEAVQQTLVICNRFGRLL